MNLDNKDYDSILDKLEALRSKNNKNWMDLFRLAFKVAPDEAKIIARGIFDMDHEILAVARELYD